MSALAFGPSLTCCSSRCCRRPLVNSCWLLRLAVCLLLAHLLLLLPSVRAPGCLVAAAAAAAADPPAERQLPNGTSAEPSSSGADYPPGGRRERSLAGSGADKRSAEPKPPGLEFEAYDELPEDELEEEYVEINVTAEKSKYLGSPCDNMCNPSLQHVHCHPESRLCECEKSYPVQLGPTKGCAKAKKLGEQCLYQATCVYTDQHSTCTQVQHNAVCECEMGYHRSAYSRHKKQFCAKDLVLIATDLPTLLGVASGIAVFTGLICFVLQLFSRARYTRPRHYANAGHAPPMLFSSDTGIPLTLHGGRPSSRTSQRSSGFGPTTGSAGSQGYGAAGGAGPGPGRKQSSVVAEGNSSNSARAPLVPASRAGAARAAAILLISCHRQAAAANALGAANSSSGSMTLPAPPAPNGAKHRRALSDVAEGSSDGLGSRRPSLASIHSSTSSAKSYSARRFERERNEKEQRLAFAELKRDHQQQQQQQQQHLLLQQQQQPQTAPTPSPRTPHSTDELLPSVEEATEIFYNEQVATTSGTLVGPTANGAKSKPAMKSTGVMTNEPDTPLFESDAKPGTSAYNRS